MKGCRTTFIFGNNAKPRLNRAVVLNVNFKTFSAPTI